MFIGLRRVPAGAVGAFPGIVPYHFPGLGFSGVCSRAATRHRDAARDVVLELSRCASLPRLRTRTCENVVLVGSGVATGVMYGAERGGLAWCRAIMLRGCQVDFSFLVP